MVETYRLKCQRLNETQIGNTHLVLVEGKAKKTGQLQGRNELYTKVLFDETEILTDDGGRRGICVGDYVAVKILGARSSVMTGVPLYHTSLQEFYRVKNSCDW